MTTDGRDARATTQDAYEELFAAIAGHRPGVHADRMAARLLRRVAGGRELVALVDDGRRAVFYDASARRMVATPFDEHGVRADGDELLWDRVGDPAAWVDARAGDLDWVHPDYRWVLDLDDDCAAWRVDS